MSQHARPRIEPAFGWLKTIAWMRKVKLRGLAKVDWLFALRECCFQSDPVAQAAATSRIRMGTCLGEGHRSAVNGRAAGPSSVRMGCCPIRARECDPLRRRDRSSLGSPTGLPCHHAPEPAARHERVMAKAS
jgi:hypothetical protein